MPNNFNNRSVAVSQRIYGHLLRAYPQAHREEYGPAMAQLFRDQCRDAWKEARGWGMAKLWLRVLPDLVNTSIVERLSALNPRKTMNDKISAVTRPATSPLIAFIAVFAIVFSLVLTASIIITFILPESYASHCKIKVGFESQVLASLFKADAKSITPNSFEELSEIIQSFILSQLVLQPTITNLNLNAEWGRKYYRGGLLPTAEAMEILKHRLSLAPDRGTKCFYLTAFSEDPREAAAIANAVAESFRDICNKNRPLLASNRLDYLQRLQNLGKPSQGTQAQRDALGQQLNACIEAQKADLQGTNLGLMQIISRAEPGFRPVKPNKPLNIFIGAVAGGFLGLIAGGGAALVTSKLGKRGIHVVSA